jgi:phosphonate transport system permease protein
MNSSLSTSAVTAAELPPRDLKRSGASFLLWAFILAILALS